MGWVGEFVGDSPPSPSPSLKTPSTSTTIQELDIGYQTPSRVAIRAIRTGILAPLAPSLVSPFS